MAKTEEKVKVEPVSLSDNEGAAQFYAEYLQAGEERDLYESAVEKAKSRQSESVKGLVEALGGEKVPIILDGGAVLRPVQRGDTWYFKTETPKK